MGARLVQQALQALAALWQSDGKVGARATRRAAGEALFALWSNLAGGKLLAKEAERRRSSIGLQGVHVRGRPTAAVRLNSRRLRAPNAVPRRALRDLLFIARQAFGGRSLPRYGPGQRAAVWQMQLSNRAPGRRSDPRFPSRRVPELIESTKKGPSIPGWPFCVPRRRTNGHQVSTVHSEGRWT